MESPVRISSAGENEPVNGNRYRAMIMDYLMPEIEARDLGNIWSQQAGATLFERTLR